MYFSLKEALKLGWRAVDILVNFINPTLSMNRDEYEERDDQESVTERGRFQDG